MPITLEFSGLRIADGIAGAMVGADVATYNNATTGQIVEISAASYANLALLSGAGKYGSNDATMALATGYWGGGANACAVGAGSGAGGTSGTFIPANNYPYAFSIQTPTQPSTQAAGNVEFGFYGAAGGTATGYTPQTKMGSNATTFTNTATSVRRYWVVKGANSMTSVQSAVYAATVGGTGTVGAYSLGAANPALKYGTPVTLNTLSTNYSWWFGIQCLATPTKQW